MKLTPDIERRLENLKDKYYLYLDISEEPLKVNKVGLRVLREWTTEVSERGWFKKEYATRVTEIIVQSTKDYNTNVFGIHDKYLDLVLQQIEKGRELFLNLKHQFSEIGVSIVRTDNWK